MASVEQLQARLSGIFQEQQALVLAETIHDAYEELVKTSDFNELKAIVQDLAAAQKRTEQSLDQLATAQARTEASVDRLAKTQDEMRKTQGQMLKSISALARQVGGLSERFGAEPEVFASEVVQSRLRDERGWDVGVLKNETVSFEKGEVEFDLFGEARDPKRPEAVLRIAGETKVALSERELARFERKIDLLRQHFSGEVVPVLFCYRTSRMVRERIQELNWILYMARDV